jgi:hypothetical protein
MHPIRDGFVRIMHNLWATSCILCRPFTHRNGNHQITFAQLPFLSRRTFVLGNDKREFFCSFALLFSFRLLEYVGTNNPYGCMHVGPLSVGAGGAERATALLLLAPYDNLI